MHGSDASTVRRWSLLDIVEALGVAVYGDVADDAQLEATLLGAEGRGAAVSIDTRTVRSGDLFVALQGTNSHGLEHAQAAFAAGAAAVLVGTDLELDDERWEQLLHAASQHGPVLVATDCDGVTALGRLARAWRRRARWRVVGITGSSGKTSTKDLLAAVLHRSGITVLASHANWNNEIGVPLTLLAAGDEVDVVICEMGMRGPGQIAWLCDVADPDIGIVTTAGSAHLELLGSLEAIVAAKAELLTHTWAGGVGIFPGNQPELVASATRVPDRLLPFGMGEEEAEDAAVLVTSVARSERGIAGTIDLMGHEFAFDLPVHGMHQARNLAAAAAALVSLRGSAALLADDAFLLDDDVTFTAGRGQRARTADGGVVIDDAYNANPESMRAALDELSSIDAPRRVAVLGRMAELGRGSTTLHLQVGMHAGQLDRVDELVLVGGASDDDLDALATGWHRARRRHPLRFDGVDAALDALDTWRATGDAVLVKASNSSGLGRLARVLVERIGGGVAP